MFGDRKECRCDEVNPNSTLILNVYVHDNATYHEIGINMIKLHKKSGDWIFNHKNDDNQLQLLCPTKCWLFLGNT